MALPYRFPILTLIQLPIKLVTLNSHLMVHGLMQLSYAVSNIAHLTVFSTLLRT